MATELPANGRTTPALQQNGDAEPEEAGSTEQQEEEEAEAVLEGEELFMTMSAEEEEEWQKRMEQMETTLQTRRDNFYQWQDGVTRRRMFAYSRLRKLNEAGRQRAAFLDEITAYISAAQSKAVKDAKGGDKVKVKQSQKIEGDNNLVSGDSQTQQQQQQQQQTQQQQEETAVKKDDTVTVKPLLRS